MTPVRRESAKPSNRGDQLRLTGNFVVVAVILVDVTVLIEI